MIGDKSNKTVNLFNYVKKEIDLIEFLETYIGCDFIKSKNGQAKSKCPMPHHKDSKASFHVTYKHSSGIWQYHCFGCESGGTIIDFCQEYFDGLDTPSKVLSFLSKKYDLGNIEGVDLSNYENKGVDLKKKMECSHILASSQCRLLLVKDFEKHNVWVSKKYKEMNDALDKDDMSFIENVSAQAISRMGK